MVAETTEMVNLVTSYQLLVLAEMPTSTLHLDVL